MTIETRMLSIVELCVHYPVIRHSFILANGCEALSVIISHKRRINELSLQLVAYRSFLNASDFSQSNNSAKLPVMLACSLIPTLCTGHNTTAHSLLLGETLAFQTLASVINCTFPLQPAFAQSACSTRCPIAMLTKLRPEIMFYSDEVSCRAANGSVLILPGEAAGDRYGVRSACWLIDLHPRFWNSWINAASRPYIISLARKHIWKYKHVA